MLVIAKLLHEGQCEARLALFATFQSKVERTTLLELLIEARNMLDLGFE